MSSQLKVRILEVSAVPEEVFAKRWPKIKGFDPELVEYVGNIIEEVKQRGDAAIVELTRKFDGAELPPDGLRVNREDVQRAYEKVSREQVSAIEFARNRIEAFEKELLRRISFEYQAEGVEVLIRASPIQRVGCYVPGGQAAYPSSLVMMITPAKVAGVPQVVVCSPPRSGADIDPLILIAADICGADEVYRVGGIQAIAALAYGTETIRPVDKLFGPGNKYVLTAKVLVSRDLPIDIPAGPSEVVVLSDGSADPRLVALDMISQAEHVDGVSVLVTVSRVLAKAVVKELKRIVSSLSNRELVAQNLSRNGLVVVCRDMEEAVRFVNKFAPEHLGVMTEDAWRVADKVTSSGLVLIGENTPVSASDYCLGTDHILPTQGFSHVYSGLSVLDFVKRFSVAECSREALLRLKRNVRVLAESEGLMNHALAVEARFKDAQT